MELIAGVDAGYRKESGVVRASVIVMSFTDFKIVAHSIAQRTATFPYIPGLLSFREVPAVLDAFERLEIFPDFTLYNGHGFAHPRRFGLACQLGVFLDQPTIGVAKNRLLIGKIIIGLLIEVEPKADNY